MPAPIQLRTQAQGCICVLALVKVIALFISSFNLLSCLIGIFKSEITIEVSKESPLLLECGRNQIYGYKFLPSIRQSLPAT